MARKNSIADLQEQLQEARSRIDELEAERGDILEVLGVEIDDEDIEEDLDIDED